MSKVSGLCIYPLKSAKGVQIDSSFVEFIGLKNDRRFMVIHEDGSMITSRKYPELLQVKALITNQKITLNHTKFGEINVNFDSFSLKEKKTKVWDDKFIAYETNAKLDEFISKVVEIPAKLIYVSEKSRRIGKHTKSKLSFADGYPLLLISEASLKELNKRSSIVNKMEQFRPNIIISNDIAFEEDHWKIIKIGEVFFEIANPCARCILTTIDPITSIPNSLKEPMKTLSKFRSNGEGDVFFGQNVIALNEGNIGVNDLVTVIEYKEVENYQDNMDTINELILVKKEKISRDFISFYFNKKEDFSSLPEFSAGQYLPIKLNIDNKIQYRNYTISSSPLNKNMLSISVKRVKQGIVSNYLHDNLMIGDCILTDRPGGRFYIQDPHKPILLISAGSGITPMISILSYLNDIKTLNDVVLYHQCKEEQDIPFLDFFYNLREQYEGFNFFISLSSPSKYWEGLKGRISLNHLSGIPKTKERDVYVCGPNGFMNIAFEILLSLGLTKDQIFKEQFTPNKNVLRKKKEVLVRVNENERFTGNNQSSLLDQIENNNISIPSKCRAGICGKCSVLLKSGKVDQSDSEALSEEKIQKGYILSCCSIPLTDIEIEF